MHHHPHHLNSAKIAPHHQTLPLPLAKCQTRVFYHIWSLNLTKHAKRQDILQQNPSRLISNTCISFPSLFITLKIHLSKYDKLSFLYHSYINIYSYTNSIIIIQESRWSRSSSTNNPANTVPLASSLPATTVTTITLFRKSQIMIEGRITIIRAVIIREDQKERTPPEARMATFTIRTRHRRTISRITAWRRSTIIEGKMYRPTGRDSASTFIMRLNVPTERSAWKNMISSLKKIGSSEGSCTARTSLKAA